MENLIIKDGILLGCHAFAKGDIVIPDGVTRIESHAFYQCTRITSVTIPDSVTSIGICAFSNCTNLTSVTIPNSVTSIGIGAFADCPNLTPKRNNVLPEGRIVAYKAFNRDMTCIGFQYEEGKTYEMDGEIKLCECGFHACLNPFDVLNYYYGRLGKDIVIHEVYLEGVSNKRAADSKVVCRKITIGRRLTLEDMCKIVNPSLQKWGKINYLRTFFANLFGHIRKL